MGGNECPLAALPLGWVALAEPAAETETDEVESPDVRYTQSGDAAIAYYVVGDGPRDLVFVPFTTSVVFAWHFLPVFRDFCARLASFSRLILFDKRGIGASDRPRTWPTLESQMEDVRAVLDAVGSDQAALFGAGHGGQMCALFAATYPERTTALVLYLTPERAPGTDEQRRAELRRRRHFFDSPEDLEQAAFMGFPSLAPDEEFRLWSTLLIRASASPSGAVDFLRTYFETDISDVLPLIRVPTLVVYRPEAIQEGGEGPEIDTAGDGFFCRFDGPARAIVCAQRIVDGAGELDLEVRAGVHTGECEVVGAKVAGIAVATGARISGLASPGEVLVSRTVKDLVAGSGIEFVERGEHELKGVPGTWQLFGVLNVDVVS